MQVSFFDSSIRNNQVTTNVSIQDVLKKIQQGFWKQHVEGVRSALNQFGKDSDQYKQAKENSPNLTTSGTFNGVRRKDTLQAHSGFIDIDIDCYDKDPEAIKQQVAAFPFVAAVYTSISGKGVCAVCCVQPNPELHETFCNTLIAYFISHGISNIDYLKDWSRARFISYDPNLIMKSEFRQLRPDDVSLDAPDLDTLPVVDAMADVTEYYSHEESIEHAWQAVGKKKEWKKGAHFAFAVDFILYCNDLGVPEHKVLRHFKDVAPDYDDAPKLVRSYYRNAISKHGSRRPLKKKYVGNGFTMQGQRGHESFIPQLFDGHQMTSLASFDPVLASIRITQAMKIPVYPRLMMYGRGVLARPGDQIVYSGKSKSGKTELLKRTVAGFLLPINQNDGHPVDRLFGFTFGLNVDNHAVIVADTEQSDDDCQDAVDQIIELSGRDSQPENFVFLAMKKIPTKKRAAALARAVISAVEKFGGVYGLFIDGTADLLPNVNDVDQVNELYDLISGLAEKYLFPVFHVIHMNPTGFDKERGVLGSEWRRKCATLLRVIYDETLSASWVKFELMRKGERGLKFLIRYDTNLHHFIRDDELMNQYLNQSGQMAKQPLPDFSTKYENLYREVLQGMFVNLPSIPAQLIEEEVGEMLNHQTWQDQPANSRQMRNHMTNIVSMGLVQVDPDRPEHYIQGFKLHGKNTSGEKLTVWN
jgi:hypothetical protein